MREMGAQAMTKLTPATLKAAAADLDKAIQGKLLPYVIFLHSSWEADHGLPLPADAVEVFYMDKLPPFKEEPTP